jgi:hypothetical protein
MILHLREVAGKSSTLARPGGSKGWQMEEVDALGGALRQASTIEFKPYETRFVRIWKKDLRTEK